MKMRISSALLRILLVSLTLQCRYSSATYYFKQSEIEGYKLTQPQRYIDCRERPQGESCPIVLNITYMQTMTVYEYDPTINREVGGRRGDDAYIVNITSDGTLQFHFPDNAPSYRKGEFLYPILGDGSLERRPVIAINNQVPGPTIIGQKDQTLEVTVVNNLATESISVHWHGQHVIDTPWMDGVAQLTQCPITSYTNFTYNFTLDQVGTHWYHAHNGPQRTDGLFGALIVTGDSEFAGTDVDPTSFEDLPEQHTLTFIDWQSRDSISVIETVVSGARFPDPVNTKKRYYNTIVYGGYESAPMPFVSGLINGAGWRYTPGPVPPRVNQTSCTREYDQNTPLAVFNVTEGNITRFRLIGAQSAYAFRFSIQGHKMTLLSSDGIPVQETKSSQMGLDYIVINSGERYDVLVQANLPSQSIATGNYWMIAETLEDPDFLGRRGYCIKGHRAYALLHYNGKPDLPSWPPDDDMYDPIGRCPANAPCYMANCPFEEFPTNTTPVQSITCVNVGDMRLRKPEDIPNTDVNPAVFLNFGFAGIPTVGGSSINGRHFLFPPSPPVTQFSDLNEIWKNNFCSSPKASEEPQGRRCTHTYKVNTSTVELVLMNYFIDPNMKLDAFQAHPVHLHGHHFWIVEANYGDCTDGVCVNNNIKCDEKNLFCDKNVRWSDMKQQVDVTSINSTRKDTVIIPPGGYVVIRFERDNPGWWFLHCHVEPHQLEGMAMVIDESDNITKAPDNFPKCGNFPTNTPSQTPTTQPPDAATASSRLGVGLVLGCVALAVSLLHLMTE